MKKVIVECQYCSASEWSEKYKDLKRDLKAAGWKITDNDRLHYCPNCVKRLKKEGYSF